MLDEVLTWADSIGLKVSTMEDKIYGNNHTNPILLTVNQVHLDQVNSFTNLGFQLCTYGLSDGDFQSTVIAERTDGLCFS